MSEGIRVLVTDGMAEPGVHLLKKQGQFKIDLRKGVPPEELLEIIPNYQAIVIRSATQLTKELIEKAKNMKLIVRAGAGVDNIDVQSATGQKIPVMNTASANSLAAAEQTLALLFCVARSIPQASRTLSEGKWDRASFKGRELDGKLLGIVGLGNIGQIVAEKAVALGMRVAGYDPQHKQLSDFPRLSKWAESISILENLDHVLEKADFLTLHVPKTKETTHLMNSARIKTLKKGAYLINCSRGGIVDESALLAAVNEGHLAGAALDVFEKEPPEFPNPLFDHPKIVCAPHLGASTFEAQERVATTAAKQMIGFFTNNDRTGVIN